jgi:hypothetical protein
MKLNDLYFLISESSEDDSELLRKISTFHRRVRAAFTRVYKLHLNGDMFSKAVYKEKLKNAWANARQLQAAYLDFLDKNTHALLMSTTATGKIKEFKDRNPFIFSSK